MAWRCPASPYSPWAAKGKVTLGSSLTSSAESRAGGNQAPALWDASPPTIAALPRLCRCLPVPTRSRGNQPSVGFKATDFPFPPRFACHLLKRSGGLSGDDTISLGTVPPPRSGLSRYSGIQMEPGCIPPPAQPAAEPPPPASSKGPQPSPALPVLPVPAKLILMHTPSPTGLQDFSQPVSPPPRELRVPRAGRGGTQKGAGLGERCHGRYTTGGARWGPGHPCSRSAALALPAANVPLWRRSGRPWVLFGSVGTCGRASLASLHTGCWVGNAGVKILGV